MLSSHARYIHRYVLLEIFLNKNDDIPPLVLKICFFPFLNNIV